ncbi:MAG: hypothetical protein BWY26_01105 [Elusimicrobia bacterium ADurb.Bin231]|nr:MAG: hypothetical protein BWY26_01105 [Elusimicrobia bacterium ADurb.Bin231]
MSEYSIGAYEVKEAVSSTFEEFISIVKGHSITSGADWGADRFELGLSGGIMVRFFRTNNNITINLISTQNKDEIPPLVVALGDMPQRVPIGVIERKLNGLRTLYAIFYLTETGRSKELESYLIRHPHGDIEQSLLEDSERLNIESISYGSWLMTIWASSKKTYDSLRSVVGLVFERGRDAYLRKLEAQAKLSEAKAIREEVQTAREAFALKKDQIDYLMEVSDKMDVPEIKRHIRDRMLKAAENFTIDDQLDADTYKKLKDK